MAQGNMAIEQVTMEICWHVFGGIFGDFSSAFYILPAIEGSGANLASERSQVGMGFLMAQEVFPSFVGAAAPRMVAVERHITGFQQSRPQANYKLTISSL